MASVRVSPAEESEPSTARRGAPPRLTVRTSEPAGEGASGRAKKPARLQLSVDTSPAAPISPSVAAMMRGRTVPLTPKSPANRRTSIRLGLAPASGSGEAAGEEEWKLDSPRSPLFLRRKSANVGGAAGQQPRSPSFCVSIPANDCPSPCCPSPLVQEERDGTSRARMGMHPDEEERDVDQDVRPGMARKKSFLATDMVPGPY